MTGKPDGYGRGSRLSCALCCALLLAACAPERAGIESDGAQAIAAAPGVQRTEQDVERPDIFEVTDTGPGLPQDWARLLEPFEQEAAAHRVQAGLGLGLPLAAGLLRLLGGRLGLVPLPSGTQAWVDLPLEEVGHD